MRVLAALPLVIVAGCATTARNLGPVALEQTQRVGNLYITPLNVVADNRCPPAQQCDLPGGVIVRARVDGGAGWGSWGSWGWGSRDHGFASLDDDTERNFTLGVPTKVGQRMIVLKNVTPDLSAQTLVASAPYRFQFTELER